MANSVTPPSNSVFPTKDADFSLWATQFSIGWDPANFLTTEPLKATIGAAATAFATSLAEVAAQKTADNVLLKNNRRKTLEELIRQASRIAIARYRAQPTTYGPFVLALGLRLPALRGTPIPPPPQAPLLAIDSVTQGKTNIRLTQMENGVAVNTRRFPAGVMAVQLEYKIGTGDWIQGALIRRVNIRLETPSAAIGAVITWRGKYVNPKGEPGPVSAEVQSVAM